MDSLLKFVGFVALVYVSCRIVLKLQFNQPFNKISLKKGEREAICYEKGERVLTMRYADDRQKYMSYIENLMSKINLDNIEYDKDKELLKKCIRIGIEENTCPSHFICLYTANKPTLRDEHKGACNECWDDCSFADRDSEEHA